MIKMVLVVCVSIFLRSEEKSEYLRFPSERKIPEEVLQPQHYALLQKENLEELPEQFSICSSMLIEYFRDYPTFFVILKEDSSSYWIAVDVNSDLKSLNYDIWLETSFGNIVGDKGIPARPWRWSHLCATVDLLTGTFNLMVNRVKFGSMIIEDEEFKNSKPHTLHKRLLFGDWLFYERVTKSESSISNVNVYRRILTHQEMTLFTSEGACDQSGDYFAWNDGEWELYGNASVEKADFEICQQIETINSLVLVPHVSSWQFCMELCPKVNMGRVPLIENMQEIKDMISWAKVVDPDVTNFWGSYSDQEEEGIWKDFYSPSVLHDEKLFLKNQPNGGRTQNCLAVRFEGVNDQVCDDGVTSRYCLCTFKSSSILRLRGLCSKSNIDSFYILVQKKHVTFYGIRQTKIEYNEKNDVWEASVVSLASYAVTKTKVGESMVLGKHLWKISNDSHTCHGGDTYHRYLKMTGCQDSQFTCSDGQCISMNQRCDQITHCIDKSDEKDCKLVSMDGSYNKHIPPFGENWKAKVNVSLIFLAINNINEILLTVSMKYTIILQWFETDRIAYHNLKFSLNNNVLSEKEMSSLWTPFVIYTNTDDDEGTQVSYKFKDIKTKIAVTRDGNFTRSSLESLDEVEIFKVSWYTFICHI